MLLRGTSPPVKTGALDSRFKFACCPVTNGSTSRLERTARTTASPVESLVTENVGHSLPRKSVTSMKGCDISADRSRRSKKLPNRQEGCEVQLEDSDIVWKTIDYIPTFVRSEDTAALKRGRTGGHGVSCQGVSCGHHGMRIQPTLTYPATSYTHHI